MPPDEYFVLGDHRSSSNDSRAWGMVPRQFIYGKAVFVYWPLEQDGSAAISAGRIATSPATAPR